MTSTPILPPRGTRPRNRRTQIRTAAAALFYEHGYERVSVADVANSVNVGPSALYRHFPSKAAMLYDAIDDIIDAFGSRIAALPSRDVPGIARTAAQTALAYRPLGVLWQREARNLPEDQQAVLRSRLRGAINTLACTVRDVRPELTDHQARFLAAAVVNAMSSISFHRVELPDGEFEGTLTDLAQRILRFEFTESSASPAQPAGTRLRARRRDQILDEAARLFALHGFESVSIDAIGAAVGIAGPTLYNYFASKHELLVASMTLGRRSLETALAAALQDRSAPAAALRATSDCFVEHTYEHTDLMTVLIAESPHQSDRHFEQTQDVQSDYVSEWVSAVQTLRPEEGSTTSRLKVHAAQMMALSLCRTPYLRTRPGFQQDLREVCWLLQQ